MKTYQGIIVDAISKKQFKGEIAVENGKIIRVEEKEHDNEQYILPGLVDAHVHIESSSRVNDRASSGVSFNIDVHIATIFPPTRNSIQHHSKHGLRKADATAALNRLSCELFKRRYLYSIDRGWLEFGC